MRIIVLAALLFLMSFSLCWADDMSLQKAYSLYNQGKMEAAIEIMDDYVKEHPDARELYFLGYAYYKIKKMDMARKYFEEAYLIDPDFVPIVREKNVK